MARYFFHTEDGECFPDQTGTELPDIEAVRQCAVRTLGEVLREMQHEFWETENLKMIVKDEAGLTLFTLDLSAITSAAVGSLRARV